LADQKISELTALTGANVADDDAIAIVDTSATETKKIVFSELKNALDTATGFVRITGDTMTGDLALSGADVTFGDNDKAIFGAGSDLQIYHASSTNNSVIQETGSGNLLIYASNISMADAGGNEFILMTDTGTGGTVELKHNTSTKLATTSTGVDITGNVTMQADDALLFIKESDGTNIAAVGDLTGEGQGGAFYYDHGGTATIQLKSYEASTIENGLNVKGDISFYEDTGTTAKFFWDASAESLGIGTSSPNDKLNVLGGGASIEGSVSGFTGGEVRLGTSTANTQSAISTYATGTPQMYFDHRGTSTGQWIWRSSTSERMRIDSSGNVGIGESNPDAKLHIRDATDGGSSSTTSAIQFSRRSGGANDAAIKMQHDGSDGVSNLQFHFGTSEAMRIDSSGNLLVGTTLTAEVDESGTRIVAGDAGYIEHSRTSTTDTLPNVVIARGNDGEAIRFIRNDGSNREVGDIVLATSSTSYNTSSDYRLKENVIELTGATTRLKQLEPKRFNFIADADTTVDGFLAHEVQSVVPEAITGTHNEVDADGNPVYQGIDQSKIVPLLVATIKELEARITALESN